MRENVKGTRRLQLVSLPMRRVGASYARTPYKRGSVRWIMNCKDGIAWGLRERRTHSSSTRAGEKAISQRVEHDRPHPISVDRGWTKMHRLGGRRQHENSNEGD